ncbi:MAG: TrkH family potassium uptake protein [Bacteroidales bacterium]|nr:TrkH family potassium uptake protein [Bacteroidales bacterium]
MVCSGVALYFSESIVPFILSGGITFFTGLLIYFFPHNKRDKTAFNRKEAYLTVTLSWLFIGLAGCLPYLFSHAIGSFANAFFESVSGFTTTGSSILSDIEALPKSILFWRSLTHWIGGIGIIVLAIIVMPTLQMGNHQLFTLESSLQSKIQPRIKAVGNRLLIIYVILTLCETTLLLAGKMNVFESVCHAFGTIATGGFSPKNDSIASYSPYIQYVIMVFMVLSGTNFVIHYYLLKREFAKVKLNEELKFYLYAILLLGSILTVSLVITMHKPFEVAFRDAFFQLISIVTTTGFATVDYLQWPTFAVIIIVWAMFLGGSTGSTSGGIKMVRHLILLKNIQRYFRQLVSLKAVLPVRLNSRPLAEDTNNSVITFIKVYMLLFLVGSIMLLAIGVESETAFSSVATCMAGIGPGIGTVGPVSNFGHLSALAKYILIFL